MEQTGREDIDMMPTMMANGFMPKYHYMDVLYKREKPHHPIIFIKGTLHVWMCKKNSEELHWMTADVIDGYYRNHKPVNELKDLLK